MLADVAPCLPKKRMSSDSAASLGKGAHSCMRRACWQRLWHPTIPHRESKMRALHRTMRSRDRGHERGRARNASMDRATRSEQTPPAPQARASSGSLEKRRFRRENSQSFMDECHHYNTEHTETSQMMLPKRNALSRSLCIRLPVPVDWERVDWQIRQAPSKATPQASEDNLPLNRGK